MKLDAPQKLQVDRLLVTHVDYSAERDLDLLSMYEGGPGMEMARFIRKRQHEPHDQYVERIARGFYLGQVVDHFVSNLFLEDPFVRPVAEGKELPAEYKEFLANADRAGTDLNSFMRKQFSLALVQRCTHTWVDFPHFSLGEEERPTTLAQQDELGMRRGYLIPVTATELLDYGKDEFGRLIWAVIHKTTDYRPSPISEKRFRRHDWTILTDEEFLRYAAEEELEFQNGQWTGMDAAAFQQVQADLVIAPTPHTFGAVPLIDLQVPEGLWVGGKLHGIQRHLIELDNAISWQQFLSMYALPVIKSAKEFAQVIGEAYFIKLDPEDSYDWAEPTGTAMKASMERRESLKDEMFRVTHQMAASVGAQANQAGRSGESKKRDMSPTLIVLAAYGAIARDHYERVLSLLAKGRGDSERFTVTGFEDFDIEDTATFVSNQVRGNLLTIPSTTFHRLQAKRAAKKLLGDATPEEMAEIEQEIDAADDAHYVPPDPLEERENGPPTD